MLLSLLKKISGNSEPPKATPVAPPKAATMEEKTQPVNLPCWKDKLAWAAIVTTPEEEANCNEIKETITGTLYFLQSYYKKSRTIYSDMLLRIRDPEKPNTLEDLEVITEESVQVQLMKDGGYYVRIDFFPTVPHCSLASLIGLCVRGKIRENLTDRIKLDIVIAEGRHTTEEESKALKSYDNNIY